MNIYNWIGLSMISSIPAILILIGYDDLTLMQRFKVIGVAYLLLILIVGGFILATLK